MQIPLISNKISKLGETIPSINLPACITCRKNAPCAKECYAKKGRFIFPSVKARYEANYEIYQRDPQFYFTYISHYLTDIPYRRFRWHASGDIPDAQYFEYMVDLAQKHMSTSFLCFTKQYEIVNAYLDNNKHLPDNLHIIFSQWGDFRCDNPHNLPTAWVKLNDETYIPENAKHCSGFCGSCEYSCWELSYGESVFFEKH